LADLFSYNQKHNEANGEDNRDGSNDNHSNNCGHEGPTDDPAIIALRRQLRKNQIGWLGWQNLTREGEDMVDFVGHMTALRRRFSQIRSHHWLDGHRADGSY